MGNIYDPVYFELVEMPIHPSARFGIGAKVGEYCVIEEDCAIGNDTIIGHHVVLRPSTVIGDHSVIAHNVVCEGWASIGSFTVVHDQSHLTMGIKIGDHTFLGPGVITTNTRHISHGRPAVPKKIEPVTIGSGVRIGAGAMLLPGVKIGDNVVIGMGAVVTKDVPDGEIWYGNPAVKVGEVPEEEKINVR